MKLVAITLNLLAAIIFIALGLVALAIYEAHCFSTYREFVFAEAINEQRLETLRDPSNPEATGYDMHAKMQQIGNVKTWIVRISVLAAAACVLNAVAAGFLVPKRSVLSDNGNAG
ncbi:hypothetical protein [Aeoliella sp.]|uniref:hypothetical protein n=1 Tax=Aeoliella sp. TaxID=2795800 RepID=UPI003CCB9C49